MRVTTLHHTLHLFLELSVRGLVGRINLDGLVEDFTRDAQCLVEVGLDKVRHILLDLFLLIHYPIEFIIVVIGDCSAALHLQFLENGLSLPDRVLYDQLSRLQEVLKLHGSVLRVLGFSQAVALRDELGYHFVGGPRRIEPRLFF